MKPDGERLPDALQAWIRTADAHVAAEGAHYEVLSFDRDETRHHVDVTVGRIDLTPADKLRTGIPLTEEEIRNLLWDSRQIHEEEGTEGRWTRDMTTVIELEDGSQYAIQWEQGLTESQENQFDAQPYPCEVRRETKWIEVEHVTIERKEV